MIGIIDLGLGNIKSIARKLELRDIPVKVIERPQDIVRADKLIMPGVGHFLTGMKNIASGWQPSLEDAVLKQKVPFLGICLGMQLLADYSEEGEVAGLGWVRARVKRFVFGKDSLPVPHVGWNSVEGLGRGILLEGIDSDTEFYFTHSFHIEPSSEEIVTGLTMYGYSFPSVIEQENIYGTQFHPEKSHKQGMQVMINFIEKG